VPRTRPTRSTTTSTDRPPSSSTTPRSAPQPAPRSSTARHNETTAGRLTESVVLEQYADLFDGSLAVLEDDVHVDIDLSVHPVQMPLCRPPVAVKDKVETDELYGNLSTTR